MAVRKIKKQLAAQEDLLLGVGKQVQERAGEEIEVTKLDLIHIVDSLAAFYEEPIDTGKFRFISILGTETPGDGGGGLYVYIGEDFNTQEEGEAIIINDGSIWQRLWQKDIIDIFFYGAKDKNDLDEEGDPFDSTEAMALAAQRLDTIIIPKGTDILVSTLELREGQTLIIEGSLGFKDDETISPKLVVAENVTVTGGGVIQSETESAIPFIEAGNVSGLTVTNLIINGLGGIIVEQSTDVTISNIDMVAKVEFTLVEASNLHNLSITEYDINLFSCNNLEVRQCNLLGGSILTNALNHSKILENTLNRWGSDDNSSFDESVIRINWGVAEQARHNLIRDNIVMGWSHCITENGQDEFGYNDFSNNGVSGTISRRYTDGTWTGRFVNNYDYGNPGAVFQENDY